MYIISNSNGKEVCLFSLVQSFFSYRLMGIYFIFFVIIKCCDCFVAQIVSSLAIGSHAILS